MLERAAGAAAPAEGQSRCPFHRLLAGLTGPRIDRTARRPAPPLHDKPSPALSPLKPGKYSEADIGSARALLDGVDIDPRLLVPNMFLAQIASPRIAEILNRTGEITGHTGERFEITSSFLFQMPRDPGAPASQAAMRRVKILHDRAGVDPNSPEFHYGVYCFTAKFVGMLRDFDTTPPTMEQERAWFNVWREIARQIGCENIPANYSKFKRENRRFEESILSTPTDLSRSFARAVMNNVLEYFPAPARGVSASLILSMVDPRIIQALGLPEPPDLGRFTVREMLRIVSKIVRFGREAAAQF